MKILGIGNAIVDVLCKVDDNFLKDNSLTKSTMKLVDENEFKNLISKLKIEETVSGGSVANSIVGLSQLGNDVGFIGKINNDNLGQQYEDGLIKERVSFIYSKKDETIPTGTCLILITPDSERTMCTFLGIAGKINEKDVNIEKVGVQEVDTHDLTQALAQRKTAELNNKEVFYEIVIKFRVFLRNFALFLKIFFW